MSSISATALSGMSAAQSSLHASAHNIANLGTTAFRRQQAVPAEQALGGLSTTLRQSPQPGNALGADLVTQLQAKNAFLANLAVFRAHDRMTGSLLDAVS